MFLFTFKIVSHLEPFVKRFFRFFFQGRRACYYLPIREVKSFLRLEKVAFVSCVSPTLFQPTGSGSHLYSAHRNTVRSGHGVKGLTDSRGSFPLGLPCPRLLYPYCITTWEICQEFFLSFYPVDSRSGGFLLPSWLLLHCITHRAICQEVSLNFFEILLPFSLDSEWIGVTRLPRISPWHYRL